MYAVSGSKETDLGLDSEINLEELNGLSGIPAGCPNHLVALEFVRKDKQADMIG